MVGHHRKRQIESGVIVVEEAEEGLYRLIEGVRGNWELREKTISILGIQHLSYPVLWHLELNPNLVEAPHSS